MTLLVSVSTAALLRVLSLSVPFSRFISGLVSLVRACHFLFESYLTSSIFAKDVIGRRPVIFIGILGASLATLLFGLQRTLPGVLLVRCIGQSSLVTLPLHRSRPSITGGFFSGNTAVIYAVLGEITDSTNQAIAFPIFGLAWPIGSIIG
jgi:MFS family permease